MLIVLLLVLGVGFLQISKYHELLVRCDRFIQKIWLLCLPRSKHGKDCSYFNAMGTATSIGANDSNPRHTSKGMWPMEL
jgi:hypothetical protein